MNIRMFSVNTGDIQKSVLIKARISSYFHEFSDTPVFIDEYPNLASLLPDLSDALSVNKLVVIFSSLGSFSAVKDLLCSSLHLVCEPRADIAELITSRHPEVSADSDEVKRHSVFPVNADVFASDDGVYSGFCCRSERNKYLMLLPFTGEDSSDFITARIIPILSQITGTVLPEDDLSVYREVCGLLRRVNATVAVANTNAADFILLAEENAGFGSELFTVSERPVPARTTSPDKFTAALANSAAKEFSRPYGIAISNIFSGKNDGGDNVMFVYTAVSGAGEAEISELSAPASADVSRFLQKTVNEVFALLAQRLHRDFPELPDEDADFDTF